MRSLLPFFIIFQVGCANFKTPTPPKKEQLTCESLNAENIFNGLRIKAAQEIIQSHIDQKKSIPLSAQSTQELATLVQIQRRISFPLLNSQLSSKLVTRVLKAELSDFQSILESDSENNPNTQKTLEFLKMQILDKLESQESWTCSAVTDGEISIDIV